MITSKERAENLVKLRTWKSVISSDAKDPAYLKSLYDARGWWNATAEDGPWYSDSDPESTGQTEAEAVQGVVDSLNSMRSEIEVFLKSLDGRTFLTEDIS
jgi:hypothetical protein